MSDEEEIYDEFGNLIGESVESDSDSDSESQQEDVSKQETQELVRI